MKRVFDWLTCILAVSVADPGDRTVSLMSYNTGLTSRIPYYKERSQYIAEKVSQSNPDFICLQEVWHYRDLYKIVKENSATYPYSFSAIHNDTTSLLNSNGLHWPPCARSDVIKMFFKMWWYGCRALKSEIARLDCVTEKAGFMDLPQQCITCITMSSFTAQTAFSDCLGAVENQMNVPGLLVLSKMKLRQHKMVYFRPNVKQILPRGYLMVEVLGLGTVACTHTTADLGKIYYEPNLKSKFHSWKEENMKDARILMKDLSPFTSSVIMGDLNSSPSIPGKQIQGDFEDTLELFKTGNYSTPYIDLYGLCTFCSGNNLVPYKTDWILDHILIRGQRAEQAQRVMDEVITDLAVYPSDHYGIQVRVSLAGQRPGL
ncbi:uncharacterized protein LOC133205739 [Saccostrea echinata]|uniref:uncharacterized protein LOC133205739 n=1 Tax=Saccostrea echinata TaxID=191078 RepID=UPI002A81F302|nr:uncharacterized protein LOC133205739 [Saccostrea echinata]XP_061197590.1 uncharacterized protein LOC133205739 [Saccostrea echinata]